MDKMKVAYETMLGLAAELVLDEALRKYRADTIYKAIDEALVQGDSDKFKKLTDELKSLDC
jgi:uncharacterized protein YpiB (UPF0302 family)